MQQQHSRSFLLSVLLTETSQNLFSQALHEQGELTQIEVFVNHEDGLPKKQDCFVMSCNSQEVSFPYQNSFKPLETQNFACVITHSPWNKPAVFLCKQGMGSNRKFINLSVFLCHRRLKFWNVELPCWLLVKGDWSRMFGSWLLACQILDMTDEMRELSLVLWNSPSSVHPEEGWEAVLSFVLFLLVKD